MELRQLEYFCNVGIFENFTRAAQNLHVSQPSITKAIKALEAELQLTLIDRTQKKISLTAEGKAFLKFAQKIMQDVEEAKQSMQQFKIRKENTIKFGLPPMFEAYLFPDFFIKFQAAYPKIELDIQEFGDSVEICQKLKDGTLDFGILITPANIKRNLSIKLLSDRYSLCLPKNHKLAKRDKVSFDDLKNEKFILQQSGTYQHRKICEYCAKCGYSPNILLCTSQLKTIKQLVTNEAGISLLPNFVLNTETDFCRKDISPSMNFDVLLAWGKSKVLPNNYNKFIDFVKSSFN
ncbi:MAG: LysR family transcriptional regulator [Selenomonadaceae bacterium]|nr:LysR family transcriptional regulator [Selenomonadaceae bacterium]